jgi:UrcA family protein
VKKLVLSLSLAVASVALAAPVVAGSGEAVSVPVQTSDLNLSSDAGVQSLYARIRGAAREACRGLESRSASTQTEHRACLRTAMDSGVMAANNDALSALHLAKMGNSAAMVAAK